MSEQVQALFDSTDQEASGAMARLGLVQIPESANGK